MRVQQLQFHSHHDMLLRNSLVFALGVFAVQSATLGGRNIPVAVVYDRPEDVHEYNRVVMDLRSMHHDEPQKVESNQIAAAEVDQQEAEKNESTPVTELVTEEGSTTEVGLKKTLGDENLAERTQLSSQEQREATKHLPQWVENEVVPEVRGVNSILNQAQEIIYNGVDNIRTKVDEYVSDNKGVPYVAENVWRDLNASLDNMITTIKDEQQQQQNVSFFQGILNGFQSVSSNFLQTIRRNNTQQQQPGFGQNVLGLFTGGFQQITGNLTSFGSTQTSTQSTVLGDDQSGQNPVSGIFSNIQNFFGGGQQQISQGLQSNQSDPETSTQGGIFQNAGNYFGQIVNVFSSTSAPGSQNEEQTSQQPFQIFQNLANQVGQNFNNVFGSQTNASESDPQTGNQPSQIFQNVGSQFGQFINQFRPEQSTPNPSESDTSSQPNPILAGIQTIGTQTQQFFGNQSGANPVQGIIQNPFQQGSNGSFTPPNVGDIGNQFGEAVNNFTPPTNRLDEAGKDSEGMLGASKFYADAEKLDPAPGAEKGGATTSSTTSSAPPEEIMIMQESVQN